MRKTVNNVMQEFPVSEEEAYGICVKNIGNTRRDAGCFADLHPYFYDIVEVKKCCLPLKQVYYMIYKKKMLKRNRIFWLLKYGGKYGAVLLKRYRTISENLKMSHMSSIHG